jgi:hypothetical protein
MHYLFNVILGRCFLNIFEAAIHSAYPCLKVPAPLGALSVYGSQKDARDIEQIFSPGHRSVNCMQVDEAEGHHDTSTANSEAYIASKLTREQKRDNNTIPLSARTSHRTTMIPQSPPRKEGTKQLPSTEMMNEAFTWHAFDPTTVSGSALGCRPLSTNR